MIRLTARHGDGIMPDDDNSPISVQHAKHLFADWKDVPAIVTPAFIPSLSSTVHPNWRDILKQLLHGAARALLGAVGLSGLAHALDESGTMQAMERLNLDGLLALWHPSTGN